MARRQKNMRLSERVFEMIAELTAIHETESEVVAVAVERLYRDSIEEQTKNKAFLDIVRERLMQLLPGLSEDRITFKWDPSQSMSKIPVWVDVWFSSLDEKEAAVRVLEDAGIQPHPVSITSGSFLNMHVVDVARAEL